MILGAKYLSAKNVSQGDLIKFKDGGKQVTSTKYTYPDGNPQIQNQFLVENAAGTELILNLNKTSANNLIPAWGNDTSKWIGKLAEINLIDGLVSGKMAKILVLKPQE